MYISALFTMAATIGTHNLKLARVSHQQKAVLRTSAFVNSRVPPPCAHAKRGARLSSSRRALSVESKFVLTPTGDGTCDHLPEDYPLPVEIALSGAEVTVGRDAPAEIVIPIPTVSGNHCQIAMVDEEFYIMDLSSTNGTFVNGKQLTPAKPEKLPIGSEVVFGDEFLARFELRDIE